MKMRQTAFAAGVLVAALAAAGATRAQDEAQIAEGEKVFRRCAACHQVGDGAENRAGPMLNGVMGRQAGTVRDFDYSPAMVEAGEGGLVWDEEALFAYLENPRAFVRGTNMAFAGLKKEVERQAVIAYIASAGGS